MGLVQSGVLRCPNQRLRSRCPVMLNAPGAQHFSILATHSWINVTMMLDEFACCPHQVAERNGLHVYAIASFNLIHLMMPRSQFPQVQMHIGTNRGRGRLSVSTIIRSSNFVYILISCFVSWWNLSVTEFIAESFSASLFSYRNPFSAVQTVVELRE